MRKAPASIAKFWPLICVEVTLFPSTQAAARRALLKELGG
jgi:hypothetical protein